MSNIQVSKTALPAARRATDPFAAMREEMERVFDRFDTGWPSIGMFGAPARFAGSALLDPALDVRENGDHIAIDVDLPGVDQADLAVTLTGGILTIKGEKKSEREEKGDHYHLAERSHGTFSRSLRLPDSIDEDKIEARFDRGVLKIKVQKKPDAVKAEKRIEVKTG